MHRIACLHPTPAEFWGGFFLFVCLCCFYNWGTESIRHELSSKLNVSAARVHSLDLDMCGAVCMYLLLKCQNSFTVLELPVLPWQPRLFYCLHSCAFPKMSCRWVTPRETFSNCCLLLNNKDLSSPPCLSWLRSNFCLNHHSLCIHSPQQLHIKWLQHPRVGARAVLSYLLFGDTKDTRLLDHVLSFVRNCPIRWQLKP